MSPNDRVSKEQVAEAAAWMAHLHGSKRTPDSDRGHQLWLKEDFSRKRAWEAATEVWDEVAILQSAAIAKGIRSISPQRTSRKGLGIRLVAVAATLSILAIGAVLWVRNSGVSTAIGEQRILALDDGSRVILNTATRVIVSYDEQVRKIELKSGEARFDVAKQADRPFVVIAGNRRVKALGTSFIVRYDRDLTAITLVDGKVTVSPAGQGAGFPALAPTQPTKLEPVRTTSDNRQTPDAGTVTLTPGQRLTFAENRPAQLDRPSLDKVVAWQRGEVVMDGMHLKDALVEMNRYSARKLAVDQGAAASLVISGVFQSGDSLSFANAVAHTYQLQVVEEGNEILLTGNPKAAYR